MRAKRYLSSLILLTASICASASAQDNGAQAQSEASQQVKAIDARILFTGRLLGYFRLPDKQMATGDEACKCPLTLDQADPEVREFLNQATKDHNTILVGTGDNFAPELFARIFEKPPYPDRRHKDRYTWDWLEKNAWVKNEDVKEGSRLAEEIGRGHGRIPMDNVACFLARAGYDAIVPGKHDFHFGPERLRYLARLLASFDDKSGDPNYHSVQMLAANLVIQTKYFKGEKAMPDTHRGVDYLIPSDRAELRNVVWRDTRPVNVSDKDSVLPWLQVITVKADSEFDKVDSKPKKVRPTFEDVEGELRSADKEDPFKLGNTIGSPIKGMKAKDATYDFSLPDDTLKPGENYFFCLKYKKDNTLLPYCTRFSVYSPFFTYESGGWGTERKHPKDPDPYVLRKLTNGTEVVIFGVVDPELREHVGELNFAWNNPVKKYKTEILVIDPVIALGQLMQKFEKDNPHFHGVKILLAQMSAPQAKQLSVQVAGKFNVVISQGQLEYATPNQTSRIDLSSMDFDSSSPRNGLRPTIPTFLAVPPPYFNPESRKRAVQVREIEVTNKPEEKDVWEFAVKEHCENPILRKANKPGEKDVWESPKPAIQDPAEKCKGFDDRVFEIVDRLLKDSGGKSERKNPEAFRVLTLQAMLKGISADVALIQKRDFFWPLPTDDCSSPNLQDQLDRILWKGDFLMRRQISGTALKEILARSKAFDDEDESTVSLAIEKGRGLIRLGVTHDSRLDEYFINGIPLDPGRLYTVATTDYIGLGDTGYPELTRPAVGDPQRPRDFQKLDYIGSLVCAEMRADKSITCEARLEAEPYLDKLSQDPTDLSPRLGYLGRMKAWVFSGKDPSRDQQELPTQEDLLEQKQQDRPLFSVSLEKASIGFSGIRHRFSEQDRARLFAGIPISQLGSHRSHSWDFDQKIKVTLAGKWVDRFAFEEVRYSTDVTRNETGPTIVNQKKNELAFEGGAYLHRTKELPRLVFLTAARYETQFAGPINFFDLGTNDKLIVDNLGRSYSLLLKLGPRWENRKSSIEGGYQFGEQFNAIRQFVFEPGHVVCKPGALKEETLQTCITNNSQPGAPLITSNSTVKADREARFRHGLFLNFKLVVPFHSKLSYTLENQGELFFTRPVDNSTDARYQDILTQTLSIPLFDNLYLEPKLEVFRYQNKVERTRFWQNQYSLTINYKFDWFKGNRWRDAMWYKKPDSK